MKPDWERLGASYANSSSVLIADVNCALREAQPVCIKYRISGYPSLRYWKPGDKTAHTYESGVATGHTEVIESLAVCAGVVAQVAWRRARAAARRLGPDGAAVHARRRRRR